MLDDRRRDVRQAERVERARRVGAVHLLRVDDLLHDARAAAAPLFGPGDRREPGVGKSAVPGAQTFEPLVVDLHRAAGESVADQAVRQVGFEPGAELLAKRLGFYGVAEVHAQRLISRCRRVRAARRARVAWRRSRRAAPRSCAPDRRSSARP